jgi:hypothetical protein
VAPSVYEDGARGQYAALPSLVAKLALAYLVLAHRVPLLVAGAVVLSAVVLVGAACTDTAGDAATVTPDDGGDAPNDDGSTAMDGATDGAAVVESDAAGPAADAGADASASCAAVTDGNYYVDPALGSDVGSSGRKDTCPFATITRALAVVGEPTSPVTIHLLGDARTTAPLETFPLVVPKNVEIASDGAVAHLLKVPAGLTGVRIVGAPSRLTRLGFVGSAADAGAAGSGIELRPASVASAAAAATITGVDIVGFAGSGIDVLGGTLVLGEQVHVTDNKLDGLRVDTASGAASAASVTMTPTGAAVGYGSADSMSVTFRRNGASGVHVKGFGAVAMTGKAADFGLSGVSANLLVDFNAGPGILLEQTPGAGGAAPPVNTLAGLFLLGNGRTTSKDGLTIGFGSSVKLRGSAIVNSGRDGVRITDTVGPAGHDRRARQPVRRHRRPGSGDRLREGHEDARADGEHVRGGRGRGHVERDDDVRVPPRSAGLQLSRSWTRT